MFICIPNVIGPKFAAYIQSHGTKTAMLGCKRCTGTKQTKKITILNDVSSLFVLSQCVSCVPTWWFLHHVTVSCKGPIRHVKFDKKRLCIYPLCQ